MGTMHGTELPDRALTREYIQKTRATADASAPHPTGNALQDFARPDAAFHLHVLASGSKGNAAVVETPDTAILIDCGLSKKAFMAACDTVGFDPARIEAVIVTHEHTDHTKGLGVTLRGLRAKGALPRVYATQGTRDASAELAKIAGAFPITCVENTQALSIGTVNVQFIPTSHDAADPVCMVFESLRNGFRDVLGFATDTGIVPDGLAGALTGARLLALESNHDAHMLQAGPYPASLKRRVAGDHGHLSNEQSDEALDDLLQPGLETVIGMHLSETNNLPRLARAALEDAVARTGHDAQVFTGFQGLPVSIG